MAGRPSIYTSELGTHICGEMADGRSLRSICREEGMPALSTVMLWLSEGKHPEFSEQYQRAMHLRADAMFEDMQEIADNPLIGEIEVTKETRDGTFTEVKHADNVQRADLMVKTRQWMLGRMAPKKYGDKITTEVTGADGEPLGVNSEQKMLDMALKIAFILHQGVKVKGLTIEQPREQHDVDANSQATVDPASGG